MTATITAMTTARTTARMPTASRRAHSRRLRGLFLSALCALAAVGAPQAVADTVRLKDGSVHEGAVVELGGNSIAVSTPQGRRTILRRDVDKVSFTYHETDSEALDADVVLCRNGNDIRGDVRTSTDGRTVHVRLADGNEVSIPREQVLKIVPRGTSAAPSAALFYSRAMESSIAKDLEDLASADAEIARVAEKSLVSHGIFAIDKVEDALAKEGHSDAVTAALRRIHLADEYRKVVGTALEQIEPRVYEILVYGSYDEREQLFQEFLGRNVEETMPLARLLLLDESQDPRLRATVVGMLGGLRRDKDLIDIYDASRGQVQLSVAIALGKNRILLGVPTLIEAMELQDRGLRRLSFQCLKEFTGEDLGYHPDDTPSSRRRAVERWKKWWESNRDVVREQSVALLAGEDVESAKRIRARQFWTDAGEAARQGHFDQAEALLRRSVSSDPSFFSAHVHLAAILYAHRDRVDEARSILEDLLRRRLPDVDDRQIRWVHYHLGKIHVLTGKVDEAIESFALCIKFVPEFLWGQKALADVSYWQAMHAASLGADARRQRIQGALAAYLAAIELIDVQQRELIVLGREDLPPDDSYPFDMREHNRTVLDVRESLRVSKAQCYLGVARCRSLLGEKDAAIDALLDGIGSVQDNRSAEGLALQIEIRNYVGMLYEERNQLGAALREYRIVLKDLDETNAVAVAGIKRLRDYARSGEDGTSRPRSR